MPDKDIIRQWVRLMDREDNEINLGEASLVIARTEYPNLDVPAQLCRLDRMASQVRLDACASALSNIEALNAYLFEKENFAGNEEEYDDPRNSFLNDVLDRKKGIPITLSLVYTEVARRHSLPVVGVGFPGHFLVKYMATPRGGPSSQAGALPEEILGGEILVDPYHRGAILTREDCVALLKSHFGQEAQLEPQFLAPSAPKEILARMLNNLKGSYFRRQNFSKVLTMIELALAIDPASARDVRDRGMVYFAMKRYNEALADFKAYLSLSPREDPGVQEVLQALHRIRAAMN
ncbi:MAG TPA: transglutaminase-like domain-containing protein [Terriglobia bacterium]|nr:transglutaminase-like domain-containing protein [Terriglobia bacterium]